MNHSNNIKKTEKKILILLISLITKIKKFFVFLFQSLAKVIKQKITIMFIPHSEKKVFNLRINLFMIFFIPFIISLVIILITYIGFTNIFKVKQYNNANKLVQLNQKRALEYEELINEIIENHSIFKSKLDILLTQLNREVLNSGNLNNQGGPINRINMAELSEFDIEKFEVKKLLNDYQYSIQAFGEINKLASVYNKLLKDLPFGSPVKGPYAITSAFGLRIHPLFKVLDMHQGLDLASQPGTQIVATAPGIVEKVEWNPMNYGWYCKISHGDMGFSTLYAHLRSQPVIRPGDNVVKGQLIGYMGGTGATTGIHLHYEVRLGDRLLDPMKLISTY